MDTIRAHVFIKGKVQGVFYRDWTAQKAKALGLFGWVKNLEDGRVEAVFEGPKLIVEEMVNNCREGSVLAKVEHVDALWEPASGELSSFEMGH
jgi:acylphosphatase